MTREEAAVYITETFEWVMREYENHRADRMMMQKTTEAFDMAISALLGPQPDPDTGLVPCGGKMRIDTPPGNDSVRASTGFQRDGGDKTERRCMANQCIHCGQEMPEGDQVCGHCRRQHGY